MDRTGIDALAVGIGNAHGLYAAMAEHTENIFFNIDCSAGKAECI